MTPDELDAIRKGLKDWLFCSRDQPVIEELLAEIDRLATRMDRMAIILADHDLFWHVSHDGKETIWHRRRDDGQIEYAAHYTS